MPRYILLKETASTNTYLARMAMMLPSGTVIYTNNQVEGRGQRGNSWEAEPGKNLTFSMLLKDSGIEPSRQFFISEAVALAIADVLSEHTPHISIKWPNDIYYQDKKICGILIEHSLSGNRIAHSILGAGININQTEFVSDAPNPVSLKQITGKDYDLDAILRDVCCRIEQYCGFEPVSDESLAVMHARYLQKLYRYDGKLHTFALPNGDKFQAEITDVKPTGMFCLKHADGNVAEYAFKEVAFVI